MARPSEDKTETLMVRLSADLKKEIKIDAATNGKNMSQIMIEGYALYKKKQAKVKS